MANKGPTIQIPLTLEQLAIALRQLPPQKIEDLEMLLDEKFGKKILKRMKIGYKQFKRGKTISLGEIQKEFSK